MSNTTTRSGNIITITGLDAKWVWSTDIPDYKTTGIKLRSIRFNPSSSTDRLTVKNESSAGADIFRANPADGGGREAQVVQYFFSGGWFHPVIDCTNTAQCAFGAAASAYVTFEIE